MKIITLVTRFSWPKYLFWHLYTLNLYHYISFQNDCYTQIYDDLFYGLDPWMTPYTSYLYHYFWFQSSYYTQIYEDLFYDLDPWRWRRKIILSWYIQKRLDCMWPRLHIWPRLKGLLMKTHLVRRKKTYLISSAWS